MIGFDLGRIERAKEERRLQMLKWYEYDRRCQSNSINKSRKKDSRCVEFRPDLVFLEAASRGDVNEVRRLVRSGINPDVGDKDGLTALHQCCIDNNLEVCTLLLESKANVNAKDNEMWTPLHAAAACGNKELCSVLINWGADLLALNVDGNMPYDLCDDDDTLILVETEMAKRHVTQQQIDETRLRPEKEMLSDLKCRYNAGDDLQSLDSQGAAPIHIAAACGFVEVARYLLQVHVDPQQPDVDGWLPIHIAVSWGQLEIIELLVSYGADLEATTKCGQTVYSICESKAQEVRLREVWNRREELRNAVKQNTMQSLPRNNDSIRRKSNTSILRTSIRDKHRLTHVEAQREKQLGEQAEAKLACEASANGLSEDAKHSLQNSHPIVSLTNTASPIDPRQPPADARDHRCSPQLNGFASSANPKDGKNQAIPSAPLRVPRSVKPHDARIMSPPAMTNTTTMITSVGVPSVDGVSLIEAQWERSSSRSNHAHRIINGQMPPASADSVRSSSSQRPRPTPPSRDNRSRTPRRSEASSSTPVSGPVVTAGRKGQETISSPLNLPLPHDPQRLQKPLNNEAATPSFIFSTGTIDPTQGGRRKPFACCHTM